MPLLTRRQNKTGLRWFTSVFMILFTVSLWAATTEFNSSGGTTSTNGLHFYIDDSTQLQVRRLNNTGQVYHPSRTPPNSNIDNGIFLRANGRLYGPRNFAFTPNGGMYNVSSISAVTPPNPVSDGQRQSAISNFQLTSGPQVSVVWKYIVPFDFITAEVTLVIPDSYPVTASNPVRYYHVVDTYLGGSDNGCGVRYIDENGKWVIGTYPPPSGTTCPSSTAVPAGVNVVESFRERSGPGFSYYCVNTWNDFWSSSGSSGNCAIAKSGNMANVISTTYRDTGIGIQYSFTNPGTYTFSYDFVVGTTEVPEYDHLEIRHPGSATLCPQEITVLACTVATVPCPTGSLINTGTLTGSILTTPVSPTVTKTPSTFTLGSTATTATVKLQGNGAATYTLSASGLSSTPLNGVKCWNTSTNVSSCSFVVTNIPCVSGFECIETGQPYANRVTNPSLRNPLYTKVTGTGFTVDVVALQSDGSVATAYTAGSGVTVELFSDTVSPQPACSTYSSPIATQSITFSAADAGRKTLTSPFVINQAYRKVRCRVVDSGLSVQGCSSDDFAIRPAAFNVTSSNAIADAGNSDAYRSQSATPVFKAGADAFSLTAATNTVGYDGVPLISTSGTLNGIYSWAYGASPISPDDYYAPSDYWTREVGTVSGTFAAADPTTGNALGNQFRYSEAGYFRFQANAVYDDTFTAIDQPDDCNPGFSNAGSKAACNIGHPNRSVFFGRFIPDHFVLTPITTTPACSGTFTYFGQEGLETAFQIEAQNGNNQTTKNYTNNAANEGQVYGRLDMANAAAYHFSATGLPVGVTLTSSITNSGDWVRGIANVVAKHTLSRSATPVSPASVIVKAKPVDPDGVTSATSVAISNTSEFRYGRLIMPNVYGSELLPLDMQIQAQYWNGNAYQRNQLDSCSVIPLQAISMENYKNNLNACETILSGNTNMVNGKWVGRLSKPGAGNSGSVDVRLNLNTASGNACVTTSPVSATSANMNWFGNSPQARATFGLFKSPIIYLKENF